MKDKWQHRFLTLAKHISRWSKDTTKVGAVIVDPVTNQVVGLGYNGFPRGVDDSDERLLDRDTKLRLVVHAELNAILNANRSVRGCHMYIYPTMMGPSCCPECAKAIVQSGITRVYGYVNDATNERWQALAAFSNILLTEGGVEYISIEEQENGCS